MVVRKRPGCRRAGSSLLETALVLTTLMVFVLGVFEYSRLLMNWSLLDNAAREGCRYALVNNTSPTLGSDVQARVLSRMGGQDGSFSGFTVAVTGASNGAATPVGNLAPGDLITVTVSGSYRFMNIIPAFQMPSSLALSSSVTMVCEGGGT